jgi:ribosomal protein S18 acetylase RimI-like enzyme
VEAKMPLEITPATQADFDSGIWDIFKFVSSTGDSYIYPPETTKEEARKIWMENTTPFVARIDGKIVGSYLIRQNRIGLGSHVCNAAYIVHPDYRQQKIGTQMCEHSLKKAKEMGFHSMQFNMVVSTNTKAVSLWMKMGFEVVGTVPEGFRHMQKGLVDVYIMHRFL